MGSPYFVYFSCNVAINIIGNTAMEIREMKNVIHL